MFSRRAASILTVVWGLAASKAYAFIDPPWITPSMPTTAEVVSAQLHMGICDAVAFRPGYPQITQQGNAIRLVEYGDRAPTQDLCIYPIVTTTQQIGAFAPGDYLLTVDFSYDDYPLGLTTITLGRIPFTVSGVVSAAIPTLTPLCELLLLALLISMACWASAPRRGDAGLRCVRFLAIWILVPVFVLHAPNALAFFDPPWVAPASPTANDVVSVNIRGGICDGIFFKQGFPQITQQGHAIRILEYGHHWDDLDLCVYDIGTLVAPIGTFPPGDYTLTVDFFYEDYPFGYATTTLGVVPFTVAGATPVTPVPALTTPGFMALLVLTGFVALRGLRTVAN